LLAAFVVRKPNPAVSTEASSRQHEHYRIALLPVSLLIEQAGGEGLYFRMESGRARGAD